MGRVGGEQVGGVDGKGWGGAGRKDRWEGLGGEQVGRIDGKGWGGSR